MNTWTQWFDFFWTAFILGVGIGCGLALVNLVATTLTKYFELRNLARTLKANAERGLEEIRRQREKEKANVAAAAPVRTQELPPVRWCWYQDRGDC